MSSKYDFLSRVDWNEGLQNARRESAAAVGQQQPQRQPQQPQASDPQRSQRLNAEVRKIDQEIAKVQADLKAGKYGGRGASAAGEYLGTLQGRRQDILNRISSGRDINTTLGDVGREIINAPARGIVGTTLGGLAGLADVGGDVVRRVGRATGADLDGSTLEGIADSLRETGDEFRRNYAAPEAASQNFLLRQGGTVGEALGSTAPFLVGGLPVRGATLAAGALGVGSGADEQNTRIEQQRALGRQVSEDQEFGAELLGGAVGLTELLPVRALLSKLPEGYGNQAVKMISDRLANSRAGRIAGQLEQRASGRIAGAALEEGVQEAVAGVAQDLIELGVYNPDVQVGQNALNDFVLGGVVGGTIRGGVEGVRALAGQGDSPAFNADDIANPRLEDALRATIPDRRADSEPLALPSPGRLDLDGADDTTPLRVKGLNLTPRQIIESAQQNDSDPRIANILSQPVDPNTKAGQIARIYNGEEARRAEALSVPRLSPLVGGKNRTSDTRAAIARELSQYGDEVIEESPVLSAMRDAIAVDETGKPVMSSKQAVDTIRGALAGFRPATPSGQTIVARPERGGDGSVLMTPDQVADEAQREREAQQAFRLSEARQRRYEQQTATGGQREDLRPGAAEPQEQFFLDPQRYGEELGGTPVTITESLDRAGYVRVQYTSPTEVYNGQPVIISEEVPTDALRGRVVRGSPRMTQDFVPQQRDLRAGIGTEMAGPRDSIDRTSSRAVREPFESNFQQQDAQQQPVDQQPYVGGTVDSPSLTAPQDNQAAIDGATDAARQLPAPPRGLPAPDVTGREETAEDTPSEQPDIPDQAMPEEDMLDVEEHPRMVEHNEKYDAAVERVSETENTSDARRLAKRLIREGLLDSEQYAEIDARIKDVPNDERHDEAMAAIEDALEEQRDNVGTDIADEIRSEDDRYFSSREARGRTAEPQPTSEMSAEEAQGIIKESLEQLKKRGQLGRVAAARIESLLDNKALSANEAIAAFRMADVASKIVKSRLNLDVQFVPDLRNDRTGQKVQGSFQPLPLGGDGFAGVVKLSLSQEWSGIFSETAAHEVFHVLQRVLERGDPQTFKLLNSSFRDGMTLNDIHPSLQRLFKNTRHPRFDSSVWEVMQNDDIFQNDDGSPRQWAGYGPELDTLTELQAYVFGYLNDAIRYGAARRGLAAQFSNAYDFISNFLEAVRNGINGLGFTSTSKLWRDAASGQLSERAGDVDISTDSRVEAQLSARGMQSLDRTFSLLENRTFKKGRDLKVFIQGRVKPALERSGIDPDDFESDKLFKYLTRSVVKDAEFALQDNANAVGWYDEKVSKALSVLSLVHPEIATDPQSKFAFVWALAVTSNGLKVNPNFQLAEKAYSAYKETGRMPNNIGIGEASEAINQSLDLFNVLMDRFGFNELESLMTTKSSVKDIEAKTGLKISGEGKNEQVFGAAILGPKIGNGFFANLYGYFDQLTMDRWLMRTWGRWTGTLIKADPENVAKSSERLQSLIGGLSDEDQKRLGDIIKKDVTKEDAQTIAVAINKASVKPDLREQMNQIAVGNADFLKSVLGEPKGNAKHVGIGDSIRKAGNTLAKYIDGQKEAPAGANERKFIRKVFGSSLKTLQKTYPKLTMADLQALLWYPEKRLYEAAKTDEVEKGYEDDNAPDYANAAVLVARNAGVGEERIRAALDGVDNRRRADVGAGGAGRGDSGVSGEPAQDVVNFSARRSAGRGGRLGGRQGGREIAPLEGAPASGGGPIVELVEVAEAYAVANGIPLTRQSEYAKIDEAFSRRLADAYEAMEDAPQDPAVKAAYADLIRQTRSQYDALERAGYRFSFFDDNTDPYGTNPFEAMRDLRNNKRMAVYSTVAGYGSDAGAFDVERNPMLADTGLRWPDQSGELRPVLANDLFRAVHDAFGHGLEGAGFRARGEENAWQAHARLFTGPAVGALTTETRGQNSWLNYGPYGENNRTASLADTVFAPQKIGLMPEWTWTERVVDAPRQPRKAAQKKADVDALVEFRRESFYPSKAVMLSDGTVLAADVPTYYPDRLAKIAEKIGAKAIEPVRADDPRLPQGEELWVSEPPVNDDGTITLQHWGPAGLTETDPSQWGASDSLPTSERNAISSSLPRTYFGIASGRPGGYIVEFPSRAEYEARVPADKLYDISRDPDGLKPAPNVNALERKIKDAGYIGYWTADDQIGMTATVFEPVQLTEATTESANQFSARRSVPTGTQQTPLRPAPRFTMNNLNFGGVEPGKMDDVVYQLQDKLIDVKRLQKNIEKSGKQIGADANVYRAEELYHGRAAKRAKDFVSRELNPLIEDMKSKGVPLEALDEFLHASHAKERNEQIRKVNPDMQDGGSGMTDAQADAYLNGLPKARRNQLEKLAARVNAIVQQTQKMMVEYGLETQETIDTWNDTYKSYVPLQREGFEDEMAGAGGQGMSVRGSSSRRAMGSDLGVVDILANVAMQRERVISRGERNRVGNALMSLAIQNPNDGFWFVVDPKSDTLQQATQKLVAFGIDPVDAANIVGNPVERFVDPRTGRLVVRPNTRIGSAPNVMATRINGEDRFVIFNARNPRAARAVTALKNLDTPQIGGLLSAIGRGTRYFASINTQYNPAFGLFNLLRDVQGATLNLTTTPLAKDKAKVIAGTWSALGGMYGDLRAERKGGTATSNWAQLAEEFELAGGKTGFRDMFRNSQERAESIENALNPSKLRRAAMATGGPVFNWLSDFNEAIENSVRLSAYKVARDKGMSQEEAASIAKNITVNFNRKGAVGSQAGMLYAFFNASVQGTARMGETLTGPAGKKIVMGGLLLGFVQAFALAAAGFEDDEVPDWLKDKNVVIPTGDGRYFAFPMPLGFHAIPALSRRATEFFMSDNKSASGELIELFSLFADAFNPIGNGGTLAETLSPTLGDPVVQLATNRDFSGRPIYQEDFSSLDPTPGPERTRESASVVGKFVAEAIDWMSGGNSYVPGKFSPTGDEVDFVIGAVTGGAGRTVLNTLSTAKAAVTGEDLPNYKIPIVGRMIGDKNEAAAVSNRFYATLKEMNGYQRTLKGMEEKGDDITQYLEENPVAEFSEEAADYEREISALKKEKKQLVEEGASQEDIAAVTEEMQQLMAEFNQRAADYKRQ